MLSIIRPMCTRIEPHFNISAAVMSMRPTANAKVGLGHKRSSLAAESFLHANNVEATLDELFSECFSEPCPPRRGFLRFVNPVSNIHGAEIQLHLHLLASILKRAMSVGDVALQHFLEEGLSASLGRMAKRNHRDTKRANRFQLLSCIVASCDKDSVPSVLGALARHKFNAAAALEAPHLLRVVSAGVSWSLIGECTSLTEAQPQKRSATAAGFGPRTAELGAAGRGPSAAGTPGI